MPGQGPVRLLSLSAAITDETRGKFLDASQLPYLAAYVSGVGTISSGVISFEEADWNPASEAPYGGTWSDIGSSYDVTASSLSGGAMIAVHLPVGKYHFVRPYIETAIGGGGSVSVVLVGTGPS